MGAPLQNKLIFEAQWKHSANIGPTLPVLEKAYSRPLDVCLTRNQPLRLQL